MPLFRKMLLLVFFFLVHGESTAAEPLASVNTKVAVFFPEAREPYKTIYRDIISGVSRHTQDSIVEYQLNRHFDIAAIIEELRAKSIFRVIVLGRSGYQLAKDLPKDFKVVSGALPIRPNGISGISLISDPSSLFSYLGLLAPGVKNIHIAYSDSNHWLITLAEQAASEKGLKLNHQQVSNTAEAIDFYNSLFDSGLGIEDAIWLPLDRVSSQDKITLPLILEKAWANEVAVFSSKPSHAKRGVLFSTYPDNSLLGERLLQMVNELAESPVEKKFAALKSLQLAVNLRTAAHLGLKYSNEERQQFKVTFPE